MANPFSFSQAVFFKRETATPINQEARIVDFVARPVVAKKLCFEHAHSVYFCALCATCFTVLSLAHIHNYVSKISNDTFTALKSAMPGGNKDMYACRDVGQEKAILQN